MIDNLASATWWRARAMEAWSKRELRWLAVILAIATALRVAWVLYAAREPQELHDPFFYMFYAGRIAEGHGYRLLDGTPTAYYPIGYPATLGGVFALLKHTPLPENYVMASAFLNVFLGVATVGLAYAVAQRLFDATVGLVAALILALFPNLVYQTGTPLTETLFNFTVMAALLMLFSMDWPQRRIETWRLAAFGVLLGYSALVRPISLPFLGILVIVLLAGGYGWRRALQHTGVAAAAMFAVILPWTLRNVIVMDAPVLISTNLGDDLCMGHYPGAPGHFTLPDVCFSSSYERFKRPEYETRRDNDNRKRALVFARDHPGAEVKLIPKKARWIWDHDHDGLDAVESYGADRFIDAGLHTFLVHVADGYFFVVMAIGGVGLVGLVRPWWEPRRVFFLLALLLFAFVPLVFFGDARFHVPSVPLISVAAAWAIVIGARFRSRRRTQGTDQPLW